MAARSLVLLAGGLVVGAAIGLVLGASALFKVPDDEASIILSIKGGSCEVDKDPWVKGIKNKQVTWHVTNNCQSQQTVVIGNFRLAATPTNTNCAQATAGGATSPFQQDEEARRTATVAASGGQGEIKLKVKSPTDLPGGPVYYYNVCLGTTIKDPILVIER